MPVFGLIAAMPEEVSHLRSSLDGELAHHYAGIEFYTGMLTTGTGGGVPVVLAQSGIGKVNAALTTQLIIDRFSVSLVINSGSAGGLGEGQSIGDFVIASRLCHHDIDVTLLGLAPGELPCLPRYFSVRREFVCALNKLARRAGIPHHIGTIASGESFVYRPQQVAYIKRNFDEVIACEMEAAAVAQVCHLNGVGVVVIRGLSDIAGAGAEVNFEQYLQLASARSARLVRDFVGYCQEKSII